MRGSGAFFGQHQRFGKDGVHRLDRHKTQLFAHQRVDLVEVLFILLRENDRMYARAQRAHCLFAQAPDGEHTAAQRDLARHGDIAVYRLPRQRGEHRCRDGDTGAGSVLGDGPLREVDMDVLRLVEVRRDAELLRE